MNILRIVLALSAVLSLHALTSALESLPRSDHRHDHTADLDDRDPDGIELPSIIEEFGFGLILADNIPRDDDDDEDKGDDDKEEAGVAQAMTTPIVGHHRKIVASDYQSSQYRSKLADSDSQMSNVILGGGSSSSSSSSIGGGSDSASISEAHGAMPAKRVVAVSVCAAIALMSLLIMTVYMRRLAVRAVDQHTTDELFGDLSPITKRPASSRSIKSKLRLAQQIEPNECTHFLGTQKINYYTNPKSSKSATTTSASASTSSASSSASSPSARSLTVPAAPLISPVKYVNGTQRPPCSHGSSTTSRCPEQNCFTNFDLSSQLTIDSASSSIDVDRAKFPKGLSVAEVIGISSGCKFGEKSSAASSPSRTRPAGLLAVSNFVVEPQKLPPKRVVAMNCLFDDIEVRGLKQARRTTRTKGVSRPSRVVKTSTASRLPTPTKRRQGATPYLRLMELANAGAEILPPFGVLRATLDTQEDIWNLVKALDDGYNLVDTDLKSVAEALGEKTCGLLFQALVVEGVAQEDAGTNFMRNKMKRRNSFMHVGRSDNVAGKGKINLEKVPGGLTAAALLAARALNLVQLLRIKLEDDADLAQAKKTLANCRNFFGALEGVGKSLGHTELLETIVQLDAKEPPSALI